MTSLSRNKNLKFWLGQISIKNIFRCTERMTFRVISTLCSHDNIWRELLDLKLKEWIREDNYSRKNSVTQVVVESSMLELISCFKNVSKELTQQNKHEKNFSKSVGAGGWVFFSNLCEISQNCM